MRGEQCGGEGGRAGKIHGAREQEKGQIRERSSPWGESIVRRGGDKTCRFLKGRQNPRAKSAAELMGEED